MKKLYKLLVLCLLVIAGGSALKAQDVVAKVGDTEYTDFSAAISKWNDGTTLTLLADVERTSSITISNKSVVFDLNGHTYTSSWNIFTVNSGASLTITDTSEEGNGLITYTGSGDYAVFIDGVVTVAGGKITSSAKYYNSTIFNSGGTLNITGGVVEHTTSYAVNSQGSSTCYISGGNIGEIFLSYSSLTVSGNPTIGNIYMYDAFVDISGVTTEGFVITADDSAVTVGVDLILPEGLELQVETLPVDKLISGQTGIVSHHHEGGTATCDGQAICDICEKPYGLKPPHDFDEHGECNNCHQQATMNVTDGTNIYYADDAISLNAAVVQILEDGSRTFTVNLPFDAEVKLFTAIRRAMIDTEGVENGSINLTLAGVEAIPDHEEDLGFGGAIFGRVSGEDKNGEWVVESVTQLASINLPDVISIGEMAFEECRNLIAISAPKVQTISDRAFAHTGIGELELPEVTSIGWAAFIACQNLSTVILPKATNIGQQAFDIKSLTLTSLVLLSEDDIYIEKKALGYPETFSTNINLVLNANKKDEVTEGLNWNGFTFKSISYSCYVTLSVNDEEFGSVTGAGIYGYGEEATLVATPNEGYKFINWTENDTIVSEEAEFTFVVKGNRNLVANFELLKYEVTASVNDEEFGSVTGAGIYGYGEEATLVATPNEGYKFLNWTENDTIVSEEAEFTFVVKGDRSFVANFVTLHEVITSVNDENFGVVSGAGIYGYGEEVTLTATANEGYKFVNWTENDTIVSEEAEFTFVVKGDRSFVANFELLKYEVTASVNDEEFGSVTGAGVYGYGEEATLVAIPNEGYKFLNWTENDTIVSEEAEFTFVVKGNRNFVANFVSTEGVDELTASFRLYPNPVNDKLNIVTETEVEEVVVYDAFGRQQTTVNGQQSTVDVSNLNVGVYFVMIKTNEGVVVKRFIKQ